MDVVETDRAPDAVGAYSQATVSGGIIRTSGQIAIDPETGDIVREPLERAIEQVLDNLIAVVEAGGGSRSSVLKTNVFLTDLDIYSTLNDIYREVFPGPPPARSVVEVANLPKQANLEIEATAEQL